jgi:hypothetical protein
LNDFIKSNIIGLKRRRHGIDEFVTKDDNTDVGDCEGDGVGEGDCKLVSDELSYLDKLLLKKSKSFLFSN